MMIKSLILLTLGGSLFTLAVRRLRQYKLRERYALIFLLLGLPFFALAAWPNAVGSIAHFLDMDYRTVTLLGVATVLAAWPNAIGYLADRLDIHYQTVTLLCVAGFLTVMVFELLTIVSVQDQKITALSQLVGILMEQQKLVEKEHLPGASHSADPSSETRSPARV